MSDPIATTEVKENPNNDKLIEVYGDKETYEYAQALIQQVNKDLELREQNSIVFNGIPYSRAYDYNQRKAINYAPPRNI